MKIILLKDVENLGKAGETTDVKEGHFRNFLSPRKLAQESSISGLRFLEAKRKQSIAKAAHEKEKALQVLAKLEKITVTFERRVGQEGKLFGSVTNRDVEENLQKQGFSIDRKHIELVTMHQVGEGVAKIKLHPEVELKLPVSVVASAAKS